MLLKGLQQSGQISFIKKSVYLQGFRLILLLLRPYGYQSILEEPSYRVSFRLSYRKLCALHSMISNKHSRKRVRLGILIFIFKSWGLTGSEAFTCNKWSSFRCPTDRLRSRLTANICTSYVLPWCKNVYTFSPVRPMPTTVSYCGCTYSYYLQNK